MRIHLPVLTFSALLVVGTASSLAGQAIHGVLVDEANGVPIEGAFVVLLKEDGTEARRALTVAGGRFQLTAPRPGRYALRADRIGYLSRESLPLELAAGEQLEYRMEVAVEAIQLEAINVPREERCVVRPEEGLQVSRVWDEARKALEAATWTEDRRLVRFQSREYERRMDPRDMRVIEERSASRSGFGVKPFASIPAERLAAEGFVRTAGDSVDYFAPDAEVLLSDVFLDTHCLRLAEAAEPDRRLGIAFEPVRGRDLPEIKGVFWLDRESAQLRSLEYNYVNLDLGIPLDRIGGRVDFEMLANGAWIVRRWWIRMPEIGLLGSRWIGGERHPEYYLAELVEGGGEVTRVLEPGQEASYAESAALTGMVYDSTLASPLGGATVYLSGTQHSVVTEDDGRFQLSGLPEGVYTVAFAHARLDSLPRLPASVHRRVAFRLGEETHVELAIPPVTRLLDTTCPSMEGQTGPGFVTDGVAPGERTGTLIGYVHDPGTRRPVTNATVTIRWSRWLVDGVRRDVEGSPWTSETTTDGTGRFQVCHLPLGVSLEAHATRREHEGEPVTFIVEREITRQDLPLETSPQEVGQRSRSKGTNR